MILRKIYKDSIGFHDIIFLVADAQQSDKASQLKISFEIKIKKTC
ncbi:hypothetical protein M918_23240 [Clostridium sp. BL8]|nr:hypothetical protein M918_23240 [Clostridium sp. BL8]